MFDSVILNDDLRAMIDYGGRVPHRWSCVTRVVGDKDQRFCTMLIVDDGGRRVVRIK